MLKLNFKLCPSALDSSWNLRSILLALAGLSEVCPSYAQFGVGQRSGQSSYSEFGVLLWLLSFWYFSLHFPDSLVAPNSVLWYFKLVRLWISIGVLATHSTDWGLPSGEGYKMGNTPNSLLCTIPSSFQVSTYLQFLWAFGHFSVPSVVVDSFL